MYKLAPGITAVMFLVSAVWAQGPEVTPRPEHTMLFGVDPAILADTIVILRPQADVPLDEMVPVPRDVHGTIERVEKGQRPQRIINTPRTLVSPLKPGVPVRLFLIYSKDFDAHYVIAVGSMN